MIIADVASILEGEVLCCEDRLVKEVEGFKATDLLSDVLTIEKNNYVLLTGLTNVQIIRTAEITNACCVVIVRNKQPQPAAVSLAKSSGVPLILSRLTTFEACHRLGKQMDLENKNDRVKRKADPAGS